MISIEQVMEMLTAASTSAFHDSVVMIPNKFHSPKTFLLSRCLFGSKNEKCSFRPEWREKYGWLHNNVWCCILLHIFKGSKKYKASTKHKPAYISIRLYKLERPYSPVETILQDYLARRVHSCKKMSFFVHFVAGILQESCMHILARF